MYQRALRDATPVLSLAHQGFEVLWDVAVGAVFTPPP